MITTNTTNPEHELHATKAKLKKSITFVDRLDLVI